MPKAKAKTKSGLGEVAEQFIEKRLIPTGKQGVYRIPGTDREERGKAAAIAATVEEAGKEGASATLRSVVENAKIAQEAHRLRDSGMSQQEIAEKVGLNITHVGNLLRWATAEPITWSDYDDLAPKIAEARDKEKISWAGIAMRAGVTKGVVQSLYREQTQKDPHKSDIGKGGRRKDTYHSGPKKEEKKKAAKKTPKKATSKKASSKKASSEGEASTKKISSKGPEKKASTRKAAASGGKKATIAKAKSSKAEVSKESTDLGDEEPPF